MCIYTTIKICRLFIQLHEIVSLFYKVIDKLSGNFWKKKKQLKFPQSWSSEVYILFSKSFFYIHYKCYGVSSDHVCYGQHKLSPFDEISNQFVKYIRWIHAQDIFCTNILYIISTWGKNNDKTIYYGTLMYWF